MKGTQLKYKILDPYGWYGFSGIFDATDILHVPGLGFNGIVGKSVVSQARDNLGLAKATEQFGAAFFGNGTHLGGVITLPENVNLGSFVEKDLDKNLARIRKSFKQAYQKGIDGAGEVAILESGAKYQPLNLPAKDAQFIESRQVSVKDVARWFNISPHFLAEQQGGGYNSLEMLDQEFLTHTLTPWLVKFEQEYKRKLFSEREKVFGYYVEHTLDAIMRASAKDRAEYFSKALGASSTPAWMTQNEIRALNNLKPIEGGDTLSKPLNTTTTSTPTGSQQQK